MYLFQKNALYSKIYTISFHNIFEKISIWYHFSILHNRIDINWTYCGQCGLWKKRSKKKLLKKLLKSFRKCFIVIKCTCLRLQKVSPLGKIKANVLRHFKVDPIGTYNLCCFCVFSNFYYCETKELIENWKMSKYIKHSPRARSRYFFYF